MPYGHLTFDRNSVVTRAAANLQERKRRESEARKKHIISVVKGLVRKGGARELTIRNVAEEAGFSTTVVYALFHDKATLITQAMDETLFELVDIMKKAAAHCDDPAEKIRATGKAYIQYGLSNPDEYALVFMERRPHAPVEAAVVEHGNIEQDPYAFAHYLFVQLRDAGQVAGDDDTLHLMTQIFWQGIHGLTSISLVMDEGDVWTPKLDPQHHVDALLDVLLLGIQQRFPARR
ncbi:TetR/AcrR family transcriptional regulator [Undibacterium sp. FT31W]|uniref:TetR/AcrR family transcriptional regulator n=1 Tax=Undibacterium griseum TaxID=2762295 RepID=A0ABR6YJ49_9BURK|nr:TetR/AcrR family transcriptional regulator [Undibacterium griseum]